MAKCHDNILGCFLWLLLIGATIGCFFTADFLWDHKTYEDQPWTTPSVAIEVIEDGCFHRKINCNATLTTDQDLASCDALLESKTDGQCKDPAQCLQEEQVCEPCAPTQAEVTACLLKWLDENCDGDSCPDAPPQSVYDQCNTKTGDALCNCETVCKEMSDYTLCEIGTDHESDCMRIKRTMPYTNPVTGKRADAQLQSVYYGGSWRSVYYDDYHCPLGDTDCAEAFKISHPYGENVWFHGGQSIGLREGIPGPIEKRYWGWAILLYIVFFLLVDLNAIIIFSIIRWSILDYCRRKKLEEDEKYNRSQVDVGSIV